MLFSNGWGFFVPYLVLYGVARVADLDQGALRLGFWACHVVVAALLAVFAGRSLRRRYPSPRAALLDPELWFWCLLLLAFLLPGAYLEFPSDPWDHLRRLNLGRAEVPIERNHWNYLAYLWGWSFFSLVPPLHQRTAADLYSAFWQALLAFQFLRFAKRLGFPPPWAHLQVLGAIVLFGNNVISFFRYYALASTMLAYIAYLATAASVLDLVERRGELRSSLATIAAGVALFVANHTQEQLFLAVFVFTAIVARVAASLTRGRAVAALLALTGVWGGALFMGRLAMADPRAWGLDPTKFFLPWIDRFGVFRVWDPRLNLYQAFGAVGLAAVVLAVVLCRAERLLAALILVPVFLLVFPPAAIAFVSVTPPDNCYRILYTLPASFMVVAALRRASGKIRWGAVLAAGAVVALGLWERPPGFGKLRFQLHRPSPEVTFEALDVTAQWFHDNRPRILDSTCVIKSDAISEFVVAAFLGKWHLAERGDGGHWVFGVKQAWDLPNTRDFATYQKADRYCGLLVMDPGAVARWKRPDAESWVGPLTGHWTVDAQDFRHRVPPGISEDGERLAREGWRKTRVPPWYWYYEPPSLPGPSAGKWY